MEEEFVDDLSLSLDTLLLEHPQAKGYHFKDATGARLPVLFSLRELPLRGNPVYTDNQSSVVRVEENVVLLGGRVRVHLKAAEEERVVRALTPAIKALNKTHSKEVTLKATGDGLLTAEEVLERLVGSKLIEGIPVMTKGGKGASRGLVIFSFDELEREEFKDTSFTDMEGEITLEPLGKGRFLINDRAYERAAAEESSDSEDEAGSSLLDPELAGLDLTMPGGGIALSLRKELEQIRESQKAAEAEGQLTLSLENVDQFMHRIEDRTEQRKEEKHALVKDMMDQYTAKYEDLLSPRSRQVVHNRLIARGEPDVHSDARVDVVASVVAQVRDEQQRAGEPYL